jgi:hypothetical protein
VLRLAGYVAGGTEATSMPTVIHATAPGEIGADLGALQEINRMGLGADDGHPMI